MKDVKVICDGKRGKLSIRENELYKIVYIKFDDYEISLSYDRSDTDDYILQDLQDYHKIYRI